MNLSKSVCNQIKAFKHIIEDLKNENEAKAEKSKGNDFKHGLHSGCAIAYESILENSIPLLIHLAEEANERHQELIKSSNNGGKDGKGLLDF